MRSGVQGWRCGACRERAHKQRQSLPDIDAERFKVAAVPLLGGILHLAEDGDVVNGEVLSLRGGSAKSVCVDRSPPTSRCHNFAKHPAAFPAHRLEGEGDRVLHRSEGGHQLRDFVVSSLARSEGDGEVPGQINERLLDAVSLLSLEGRRKCGGSLSPQQGG